MVNFEHISYLFIVFLSLILNKELFAGYAFKFAYLLVLTY